MEFPFGHQSHSHSHTHHQRRERDDDDDDYEEKRVENYPPPGRNTLRPDFDDPPPPPPPQPYYREDELPPPPPPHHTHAYHTSHAPPPPFSSQEFGYSDFPTESSAPPPPRPSAYSTTTHVEHVAYDVDVDVDPSETHHSYRPHLPSFPHHQTHSSESDLSNKRTFKVFSKANPDYSLTNRDGHVILASSDPSDEFQHWYKDEKYSTRVKDEEGYPCFSLVNKATGQAIKHSIGASHPVQLIAYNADVLDESILWTESKDLGDGFRTIRMVNNIRLNVDAFHGDKKSGGVHDGTTVVLWEWNKGDNQRWKIIPYCKFLNALRTSK
uniref:Uncharacterized protein n=1 Tax=Fagus sylvatica TaxID=28930 RepID=A0A2N9IWU6_FAGSY